MGVKIRKIRGKWYEQVDWQKRRKSKCVGHSKELALQVQREVELALLKNDMSFFDGPKAQADTVEEYADKWRKTFIAVRYKPATFYSYGASMRTHVFPIIGKRPVDKLTEDDVEQFIYKLATQADPPAQKTIALAHCALGQC